MVQNFLIKEDPKPPEVKITRLEPKNKKHSIEEGLQARVKDPCWFLGKQWQMGEFRAQNGGSPVKTEIGLRKQALNKIKHEKFETQFDLNYPLEMIVESESINFPPLNKRINQMRIPINKNIGSLLKSETQKNNWNPKRLEYSYKIKGKNIELLIDEYDGNQLDWYNFKISAPLKTSDISEPEETILTAPSDLKYRGMPNARWWAFEDSQIDIGNIKRPYLNYLTMILMQFGTLYSNDWFLVPIDHEVGCIRKITRFNIIDSFGVVSQAKPVVDPSRERKGWEVFTLSTRQEGKEDDHVSDASLFYMPNNMSQGGLESEPIEEVSILRDELANLVWAIEHKYQDTKGNIIDRHDEDVKQKQIDREENKTTPVYYWDKINEKLIEEKSLSDEDEIGSNIIGPLAKYELMSYMPPHWIPFVARQIIEGEDQIILRRGRTNLESDHQCKGEILKESTHIFEEEVPRTGIFLRSLWQLARDINGNFFSWCSRKKSQDSRRKSSGLRFDYLKSRK